MKTALHFEPWTPASSMGLSHTLSLPTSQHQLDLESNTHQTSFELMHRDVSALHVTEWK